MTKEQKTIILSDIQKIKEIMMDLGTLACKNDFKNYGKCETDVMFILNTISEYVKECK